MNTAPMPTITAVTSYLESAVSRLSAIGVVVKPEPDAPILPLLELISDLDGARVTSIARTLQQSSAFNAVVREQVGGMEIATRYSEITKAFDSVRSDTAKMAGWIDGGKLNGLRRAQYAWMKVRRGSVTSRFNKIKGTYLAVAKSANDQVTRERAILDAYQDYRFAMKQAGTDAQELLKMAGGTLDQKKATLTEAQAKVQTPPADPTEVSKLELARDEAVRALQREEDHYQIVKDIADNLTVAYNTAEVVFARIQQTSGVKERVYRQSVAFFGTNEIVFTALEAAFTTGQGLSEATNSLEAMKGGINRSLESIATLGAKQLEAGLRAGYGSTINADSVKKLVDAIVDYQQSSTKLIEELRTEATRNAKDLEGYVEDGKRRFSELVTKGAAAK
jgi:hypothetical protein